MFDTDKYLKEHPLLSKLVGENKILFECSAIAPSPSKDYGRIEINFDQVIVQWWKITLRNIEGSIYPSEIRNSYKDFSDDEIAQREIIRIFGKKTLDYCLNLINGNIDWFKYLPLNIQINIFSFVNINDIPNLSQVSKLFRSISRHNELWKILYIRQHGYRLLNNHFFMHLVQIHGWRRLFFTNRLKLQMELRRQALPIIYHQQYSTDFDNAQQYTKQFKTTSSTILTEQEEER
ncbi:unnamed protein product [Rotaria sordida]|uniref:F-box domain-containing protein n=1 Tax=Rotaria sordida TaxID=392033 RepID=A0A819HQQ2_9BILA|nr:unnamed protein product [Rotaria sordida]CAF1259533.1 unnamed protein product [Rotaria sordida]CAF1527831.1 unnamed protein product [Rotaria sordida]CAF3902057.1 unnamed protein product [Rotaria sordida]